MRWTTLLTGRLFNMAPPVSSLPMPNLSRHYLPATDSWVLFSNRNDRLASLGFMTAVTE